MTENLLYSISIRAGLPGGQAGNLVLNNIPDSLLLIDDNLRIVHFNKAAKESICNFLGIEICNGMNVLDLTSSARRAHLQKLYADVLQGNNCDTVLRFVLPSGEEFYVENNLLPARNEDGEITGIIIHSKDITEKTRRENELKQINERFDFMMKATNELLWEWDIVNNHVYRFGEGLKKVYGISDDSSIRKLEDWLQRIHPKDNKKVSKAIGDLLKASHQQTFEIEYRFKKDDGSYAYIYDRGILLKDDDGKPVRIIGAAQDISARKRLERELLKNELEYQRLIHQATVDSQEKERAEIGKELHDNINQVLTTTKLFLDLALSCNDLKEELLQKSLRNINDVINAIRHLSRSLMDPTIGDLGIVDSINDLIDNIHLTQQITVHFKVDENIETVLCRNQKLTLFRIIQESLNNVLRHAKAKNVVMNIAVEEEQLELFIQDDGIGFDPKNIKKGAGLKNIQNRVYLMNGSLYLDSQPNEGCTIRLQFPIKKSN